VTAKISIERLRTILSYDPEIGLFRWRADKFSSRGQLVAREGSQTGGLNADGYWQMVIDGQHYYGHRLAWFYVYGEWPARQIDHDNLIKSDNRISNLRLAGYSEQRANQRIRKDSGIGVKGVYLHKSGLYCARCMRKGMPTHNSYHHSLDEAAQAYAAASTKMYGEFARSE